MHRLRWSVVLVVAALVAACSGGGDDAGGIGAEGAPDIAIEGGAEERAAFDAESGDLDATSVALADRQVVRRAALDLVVNDVEGTVDAIGSLAEREGGFVAAADLRREEPDGPLAGWLTVRVPTDRLDAVVSDITELAEEVRGRTLSSDDVTEQVVDLDARLSNLRALETELLDLLSEVRASGEDAEGLLAVFDRISQTRAQIEVLQAQSDALASRVALATVTVQLLPSSAVAPLAGPWSPGDTARDAVRALADVGQALVAGLIWVVVVGLPLLVVAGALALAVRGVIRRRRPVVTSPSDREPDREREPV